MPEEQQDKNRNRDRNLASLMAFAIFLSTVTGFLLRRHEREEREKVREARIQRTDNARDQLRELGHPPQDDAGKIARIARMHYLQAEEQFGLERFDEALRLYKIVKGIDPAYPEIDERIAEAERELRDR